MRAAIVLKEDIGTGLIANASACITTGLFNGEKDVLGEEIDGEGLKFISITKIPILVFKNGKRTFEELFNRATKLKLKYMIFTKEGQSTTSYQEYIDRVKGKKLSEVEVIGIGVIGEDKLVINFCGDLPLFR